MRRDDETVGGVLALLVVIAVAMGIDAIWNNYVHGDWTCMWSECVRVKP